MTDKTEENTEETVEKKVSKKNDRINPRDSKQTDYIKPGSDAHAELLGLVKAEKGDGDALDGWILADITQYGPTATDKYLKRVLQQQINTLTMPIVPTQSKTPHKPGYAPEMWRPKETD